MGFRGEEAIQDVYPELCDDFEPYSPCFPGRPGARAYPKAMQLIARGMGRQYNQRKNRTGAFWENRYHATAAEADYHLIQCMVYMNLNMVLAGVVSHPSEWPFSGYNKIQISPAEIFVDRSWKADGFTYLHYSTVLIPLIGMTEVGT